MVHTTPAKVLLTTTFQPLVAQLAGSLAHGVRLLDQFCHCFEGELHALLRGVGRRLMDWVLNHIEPENDAEAASRVCFEGRFYCRRGKQRSSWVTLFGPVAVWRRSGTGNGAGCGAKAALGRKVPTGPGRSKP